MKKIIYLFMFAIAFAGCSVESLDSNEEFVIADAKPALEDEVPASLSYGALCAGDSAEFCVNFPQDYKGNGETKTSLVKFELLVEGDDPATEEVEEEYYEELLHAQENTQACFDHTFDMAQTYQVRYKTTGAWIEEEIVVEDCSDCEESFSYTDHGDNSYTFYYTPAEDMMDAAVVFTFAQSTAISGLEEIDGWYASGQTMQKTMDLVSCTNYEWTVTLEKNCSGNSQNSNVWTDFKVNDVSKKNNNTPNLTQSCD
ncbi:hypothetical protein [Christiangramia sp. SM2212]|uniref:Uncharacterized protein n=1 Tax=Christiangramia sediminicola TaxID=3073267 RepID=A0ABU1ER59_9FLAO|nr:hypothetical protein [Christiangramia sp. SM2212]MDR5590870.1 hypothetical protein [Christiangramia sp. SM2212]